MAEISVPPQTYNYLFDSLALYLSFRLKKAKKSLSLTGAFEVWDFIWMSAYSGYHL